MDLMEYKAKELFVQYEIPCTTGCTIDRIEELDSVANRIEYPCMVKAQVPVGGRGKAGGIRTAQNYEQLTEACGEILGMEIKGHIVKRVMLARRAELFAEWYLSIVLDRMEKSPVVIFSPMGGVDIEQTAAANPERIVKVAIDPLVGVKRYVVAYLVSKSGIDAKYTDQLLDMLQKLYKLFCGHDCSLCEINPLIISENDRLLALDAKISVDDSALARHGDLLALRDEMEGDALILEARQSKFLYIPCDPAGSVAVMSNGSGMIMSCIDVLSKNGMTVCSALDLGGGATADRIREAIRIVLLEPKAKALFINIFGGITRCDEVAGGVGLYLADTPCDKQIVVRFEGTNKELGMEILRSIGVDNVVFVDGLYEGVAALNERRALL